MDLSQTETCVIPPTGFAVVHMMLDDTRRRYELEKLWALGPQYDDQMKSMLQFASESCF